MEIFKDILKPSCATVLAGSPGCGKTSLALNIVEQYGLNEGKVVCYFTLEQSAEELVRKLVFLRAGLNTKIAESDELCLTFCLSLKQSSLLHISTCM